MVTDLYPQTGMDVADSRPDAVAAEKVVAEHLPDIGRIIFEPLQVHFPEALQRMGFIGIEFVEIETEMDVLGTVCVARPATGSIALEAKAGVGKRRLAAALDIADVAVDIFLRSVVGVVISQELIPLRLRHLDMDLRNHRGVEDIADGLGPVDIVGIVAVVFLRIDGIDRRFAGIDRVDSNFIALAAARQDQGKDDG